MLAVPYLAGMFGGLVTVREETSPDDCPTLLVQYGHLDGEPDVPKGYTILWEGRRRGDDTERYVLYARRRP